MMQAMLEWHKFFFGR